MLSKTAITFARKGSSSSSKNFPRCTSAVVSSSRPFATSPPPAFVPKAPYNIDPKDAEKTKEELRLHTRSYNDSEFKLGKHRSNALELVEQHEVIYVDGERAICDGGGGALGHPLEYISLQRPGQVERCKYCGLRFGSNSWH